MEPMVPTTTQDAVPPPGPRTLERNLADRTIAGADGGSSEHLDVGPLVMAVLSTAGVARPWSPPPVRDCPEGEGPWAA